MLSHTTHRSATKQWFDELLPVLERWIRPQADILPPGKAHDAYQKECREDCVRDCDNASEEKRPRRYDDDKKLQRECYDEAAAPEATPSGAIEYEEIYAGARTVDDIYYTSEPLHPDFEPFLKKRRGGLFLWHPLCHERIHDLDRCAHIREQVNSRISALRDCCMTNNFRGLVATHEASAQPQLLACMGHLLPRNHYWALLREIYQRQHFTFPNRKRFNTLFSAPFWGSHYLMTPEERQMITELPSRLPVYRGHRYGALYAEDFEDGNAWTLDLDAAIWHANRPWIGNTTLPCLTTGFVASEDVLALWQDGTVIVPMNTISGKETIRVASKRASGRRDSYLDTPFDLQQWLDDFYLSDQSRFLA